MHGCSSSHPSFSWVNEEAHSFMGGENLNAIFDYLFFCFVACFPEDYTQELAIAHVRRLLDIIACTTSFGQSEKQQKVETSSSSSSVGTKIPSAGIITELQGENQLEASSKLSASNEEEEFIISNNNSSSSSRKGILNSKDEAIAAMAAAKEATEKGDITGMCSPSSKLGQFYEFLSFSHLIPPFQCELQTNPHTHPPPHTNTYTRA